MLEGERPADRVGARPVQAADEDDLDAQAAGLLDGADVVRDDARLERGVDVADDLRRRGAGAEEDRLAGLDEGGGVPRRCGASPRRSRTRAPRRASPPTMCRLRTAPPCVRTRTPSTSRRSRSLRMVIPETPRSSLSDDTLTARRSLTRSTMRARRSAGIISWTSGTSGDTAVPPVRSASRPGKTEQSRTHHRRADPVSSVEACGQDATGEGGSAASRDTGACECAQPDDGCAAGPARFRTARGDLTAGR